MNKRQAKKSLNSTGHRRPKDHLRESRIKRRYVTLVIADLGYSLPRRRKRDEWHFKRMRNNDAASRFAVFRARQICLTEEDL